MASINSCKSCSKSFTDPRLLPCLHVFCKDCLEPLYSQDEGTLTCPICNKTSSCKPPVQLPRHLRIERDSALSSIQQNPEETVCAWCDENNKAEAYCEDCNSPICCDCISIHKQIRVFNKHSVVSLTQSQPVIFKRLGCIVHPEKAVKYYCSNCCFLICSRCLFAHREHEWCPIDNTELLKNEKEELQSVQPAMEDAIDPIVKATENINKIMEHIQVRKDQTKVEIDQAFKQIADAVENRRVELIQEVENTAIAKSTQLEIQKEGLDTISAGLQLALEAGSTACKDYDTAEFLAVKGSIFKASNDLLLRESHSLDLVPVTNSSLSVAIDNTQLIESISSLGSIIAASPYPPHCSLLDVNPNLAIGIAIDSESIVTLQTRDRRGKELTEGTAKVTAKITDPSSGSEVSECIVSDLDNGQYEISFDIPTVGHYHLNIAIDDTTIDPVSVNAKDYTAIENPVISVIDCSYAALVAIDHDNHYYVTFLGDGIIKIFDSTLSNVNELKLGGICLRGIAIDNHNRVMFVASADTSQIIKATLDGKTISAVGAEGTGELQFDWPMGLCLTRDGLLLVADDKNKRIQVLGSDLSFVRFIPCLSRVLGVSVDNNGNIHAAVTDCGVEVFSITGEKIAEYGQGLLNNACDVAFLPYNKSRYSFVIDNSSCKMHIFDWSNNVKIHIAAIKCGDHPTGIAISQEGSIIVCNFFSKQILKFE